MKRKRRYENAEKGTFLSAQEGTFLSKINRDYTSNLSNIFANTPSNADANMLVLGVLTKLSKAKIIYPGFKKELEELQDRDRNPIEVREVVLEFANTQQYQAKIASYFNFDGPVDRTGHFERGVGASYQCNKYLDSKLEDKCWICDGPCVNNPKLSIETNSSPKTKKRKKGGSKGGDKRKRSQDSNSNSANAPSRKSQRQRKESSRARAERESRSSEVVDSRVSREQADMAANKPCQMQRECEHILPVCSGLMFLELASTLTKNPAVSPTVKKMVKLEYRWSHSLCNGIKSDIPLIKLNIQDGGNYFYIDERACDDLSNKINNSPKNFENVPCGVKKVEYLAQRQELIDITSFLNEEVTNSNIEKVLALAFLKLVYASKIVDSGNNSARSQKKARGKKGGGPVDDIDGAIDYAFEEFDNIVYEVAEKIQRAKRGIGKLDESFWISENLKDTPSIYWQELEKTTKSSISSSPSEERRSADRKYRRTALSLTARPAESEMTLSLATARAIKKLRQKTKKKTKKKLRKKLRKN